MNAEPRRRRQPERVRATLLDAVVHESMSGGLDGVTVLGVAARAGVSKGALFHHFASRQALLEAAYAECLQRFDREVQMHVERDAVEAGRFTRAYVKATLGALKAPDLGWTRFSLTALVEPAFSLLWRRWLDGRLAQVPSECAEPRLRAARLAADGFWLQLLIDPTEVRAPGEDDALLACILSLTKAT